MKYIKNYATKEAFDSDSTRPTDASVVSSIEKDKVIYEGKNVFVTKKTCNVGDIVVVQDGELKYIKLDTYDSTLITVEPIGVVYHRSADQVRIVYKDDLGGHQWAAPFRARVEGFNFSAGGSHTISVNASTYPFTIEAGATIATIASAILAALPTGAGWAVEEKDGYVVVRRSYHTPAIDTFSISGLTASILNDDRQARYSDVVTPYANVTRNSGLSINYAGGNLLKFIAYYENAGTSDTNVAIKTAAPIRRSVFNMEDNPILFSAYKSYEDYMQDNMVRYPFSKDAIIDNNGEKNTNLLTAETYIDDDGLTKPKYPAAAKAKEIVGGGLEWWLPSFEEMFLLIGKVGDTDDPIRRSLLAIGGGTVNNTTNYWTSSERITNYSWYYYGNTGLMYRNTKNTAYSVRAVSAFYI